MRKINLWLINFAWSSLACGVVAATNTDRLLSETVKATASLDPGRGWTQFADVLMRATALETPVKCFLTPEYPLSE